MERHGNTYRLGSVEIVVHRPELEAKDQMKQEETIKRALATYGKATSKRRGCQA